MSELFVCYLLKELQAAGFTEAWYENDSIFVSPDYPKLQITTDHGDMAILSYQGVPFADLIMTLMNRAKEAESMFNRSPIFEHDKKCRKLAEWEDIVLLMHDDPKDPYFVTYKYTYGRSGVELGNHHKFIENAKENFVRRAGLINKARIFDDADLEIIQSALRYMVEKNENLEDDINKRIQSILLELSYLPQNQPDVQL